MRRKNIRPKSLNTKRTSTPIAVKIFKLVRIDYISSVFLPLLFFFLFYLRVDRALPSNDCQGKNNKNPSIRVVWKKDTKKEGIDGGVSVGRVVATSTQWPWQRVGTIFQFSALTSVVLLSLDLRPGFLRTGDTFLLFCGNLSGTPPSLWSRHDSHSRNTE